MRLATTRSRTRAESSLMRVRGWRLRRAVGGNGFITLVQSGVSFDWNSTGITTLTTPAARRASSFLPPLAGRIPQAGVAYEPGFAHAAPQPYLASRGAISAPPS